MVVWHARGHQVTQYVAAASIHLPFSTHLEHLHKKGSSVIRISQARMQAVSKKEAKILRVRELELQSVCQLLGLPEPQIPHMMDQRSLGPLQQGRSMTPRTSLSSFPGQLGSWHDPGQSRR